MACIKRVLKESEHVFYLISPHKYRIARKLFLFIPLIPILIPAITKDPIASGTLAALIIAGLTVFIVFDLILYPAIFKSKIIIGYSIVEINMPGLVSFEKHILKNNIVKAYVCKVSEDIGIPYLRLYGLSIPGIISVGLYRLSGGREAYVASRKPWGVNLVVEIKGKKYLILRPYDFDKFVNVFSKEVVPVVKYKP